MNDVDIFNAIKNHLLTQGVRCSDKTGDCAYRGFSEDNYERLENLISSEILKSISSSEEDYEEYSMTDDFFDDVADKVNEVIASLPDDDPRLMKCAVGHIIKGSYYNSNFEGSNIDDTDVWSAVKKSNPEWKADDVSRVMLFLAQRIHDGIEPRDWERSFLKLGEYFDDKGTFDIVKIIEESSDSDLLFREIHVDPNSTYEEKYKFFHEKESFYHHQFPAISGKICHTITLQ